MIKFRVWDKENKELFGFHNQKGSFFIRQDGILERQEATLGGTSPNGEMCYCSVNYPLSEERFIIQQYTGLKDKNGHEIYDGDLLKIDIKGSCIWKDYCHVWYSDLSGSWVVSYNHLYSEVSEELYMVHNKYELVGNIFENKDLLND